MLSLEVKTKLSDAEAAKRIKRYFAGQLGLEIMEESDGYLTFEGGGGFVNAMLRHEDGETHVDFETREWEEQVKKMAEQLN